MLIASHHARTQANKVICAWCPDGARTARTPYDVICATVSAAVWDAVLASVYAAAMRSQLP